MWENCGKTVLLFVKEILRCGYRCPTASRLFLENRALLDILVWLIFLFHSEFHSTMLNGVRMRPLGKIYPLTVRSHWSDGKIPSLSAWCRNQQRTDLSLAEAGDLMSEVSIRVIQLKHGQKFLKPGFDPPGVPG